MYHYLLFDLDGTLTDSQIGIFRCFQHALAHYGMQEDTKNLRRVIGPPLYDSFREFYGFSEEKAKEAVKIYRERYETVGLWENEPYAGIKDVLSALQQQGFELGVATCKPEKVSLRIMDKFGLTPYFKAITGSDESCGRTTKHQVIGEACKRMQISDQQRDQVLMIGDRFHDVLGAKESGIDCMGVRYGFAKKGELEQAGAKWVVDTVSEIPESIAYQNAVTYIDEIPKFSKKTSHDNIRYLLKLLGNPEKSFRVIHVAGTNGKGSVCEFVSSILQEAGYRTGLFISPHLVKMNERICVDQKMVTDAEFAELFQKVKQKSREMVKQGYEHVSFFEFLFAIAMCYFAKEKVDIAVLETGLGGRLDATNVIQDPLVCAITSISLDHTAILGDTIEAIAREKAGIIWPGTRVVYCGKEDRVSCVMQSRIEECNILDDAVRIVNDDSYRIEKRTSDAIDFSMHGGYYDTCSFTLHFPASYQAENGAIAVSVIELFGEATGKKIDAEIVARGLARSKWAARMEQILPGVYLDGAHNEDGIDRFLEAAGQIQNHQPSILLFSAVQDKNYEKMIKKICDADCFSVIIVTDIHSERTLGLQPIADCFSRYRKDASVKIMTVHTSEEALHLALHVKKDQLLFCVGSLYLAGEIKKEISVMRKNGDLND